jgi:predicted acyltransferase
MSIQIPQPRYPSIDALRGITVAFMIIVNSPGNYLTTFAPLLHAKWNGFTPTDWVFPTFLFVMGNAMAFSFGSQFQDNAKVFFSKVMKRTLIIFLLGYLMYWFPFLQKEEGVWVFKDISETRILGVLQRIALCYGAASFILYWGKHRGAILFSAVALLLYWLLLVWLGDFTLEGNAVRKLDLVLLGASHLYLGDGIPFDPEGLLSTLPAIVNVLAGYLACNFIRQNGANWETLAKLLMVGIVAIALALLWNGFLPINKKLWTSSYALYTIGLDMVMLALLVYVIEMQKYTKWTYFFNVFGKNTLFIYLLSEVGLAVFWIIPVSGKSLYEFLFADALAPLVGQYYGSFLFAFGWMMACWLIGYWMDKKTIYIKV